MGPKAKSKITPTQRVPLPKLGKADVSDTGAVTFGKAKPSKFRKSYPAQELKKRPTWTKTSGQRKRRLRPTITPGTVLIILVGRHKGKRVVFLKQLSSGLLLVSGPYIVNRVPLKRVSQRFVIATSTKIDISGLTVPENVDDKYFKRVKEKVEHEKGDIFEKRKLVKRPSAETKANQKAVDIQLIKAIKDNADSKYLRGYLKMHFSLTNAQYPHKMLF